jgi:hypothetical protein
MRGGLLLAIGLLFAACNPVGTQPDPATAKAVRLCAAQRDCPPTTVCREHACLRLADAK